MTTLREQLRKHERINSVEVNDYGVLHIAKQMDALLEECYQALQCPIKSQVMVELLKNNGYGATLGITVRAE